MLIQQLNAERKAILDRMLGIKDTAPFALPDCQTKPLMV